MLYGLFSPSPSNLVGLILPSRLLGPASGVTIGTPGIAAALAFADALGDALAFGSADDELEAGIAAGVAGASAGGLTFGGLPLFLGSSASGYDATWADGRWDRSSIRIPSTILLAIFQVQSLQASALPC